MEEIEDHMKIAFNNKWENAVDDLVRYARHLEKEFVEGNGKESGTMFIRDFVLRSNLSPENYEAILPAVMFYKEDYTINILNPNKESEKT
jgi:hypothetical protein